MEKVLNRNLRTPHHYEVRNDDDEEAQPKWRSNNINSNMTGSIICTSVETSHLRYPRQFEPEITLLSLYKTIVISSTIKARKGAQDKKMTRFIPTGLRVYNALESGWIWWASYNFPNLQPSHDCLFAKEDYLYNKQGVHRWQGTARSE